MPTYQYACTTCGHRFDAVQSFSDPSLTECPECTGTLRKVFSSVGIVFKGSGFYRTDSRNGSRNGAVAAGDSSSNTSEGLKSSKGSESSSSSTSGSSTSAASSSSGSSGSSSSSTPAAAAS
ncbi:MAG: FmdB family transcriptional regulator [Pseudonocardia sp.]|nr:FmdB family transcriptional regulator [Pseudonocardia sp.]